MADELSGVTPIAVGRTQRDFPRRDAPPQEDRRRQPKHQTPAPPDPAAAKDPEPRTVGSRLDVRG